MLIRSGALDQWTPESQASQQRAVSTMQRRLADNPVSLTDQPSAASIRPASGPRRAQVSAESRCEYSRLALAAGGVGVGVDMGEVKLGLSAINPSLPSYPITMYSGFSRRAQMSSNRDLGVSVPVCNGTMAFPIDFSFKSDNFDQKDPNLSTAAIIGIGVAGVVVLGGAFLVYVWWNMDKDDEGGPSVGKATGV